MLLLLLTISITPSLQIGLYTVDPEYERVYALVMLTAFYGNPSACL